MTVPTAKPPLVVLTERVDELAGREVTYRKATVVAASPGERLIDVDVENAGRLEGLPIPQGSFFPAVGDQGEIRLEGSRTTWVANRLAPGAVGEIELADPVKRQITVALEAANGKNTNTYSVEPPPVPDDGEGRTVGDAWWQLDWNAVVQGAWMWTADGWVAHRFGDEIFDSVSAAKIVTGTLGVGVQINVGEPTGPHVVIDGANGLSARAPGVGGAVEVARFGATSGGRNPATGRVTWAIDERGHASFSTASVEGDFRVGGTRLSDILADSSGNVINRFSGTLGGENLWPIEGEIGVVEINGLLTAGRIYELSHRLTWFPWGADDTEAVLRILWTGPSSNPNSAPAPLVTGSPQAVTAYYDRARVNTAWHSHAAATLFEPATSGLHRFLLTIRRGAGAGSVGVIGNRDIEFWLTDRGPKPPGSGGLISRGGGALAGGAPPPPPPAAPRVTRTDTWLSTWSRSWRQNGQVSFEGSMYQGYGDSFNGVQTSAVGFPDLTGVLAGATIHKAEIFLHAEHWWNSGGGTAGIGWHGSLGLPGGFPGIDGYFQVPGWARNEGRWVDVTPWAVGLAFGTIRGISLAAPGGSTDRQYYGRFSGHGGHLWPSIRIKYTK